MSENSLAKVNEFKSVLNSQTVRAQLSHSLKGKAGAFMSSMIDLYSGDTSLQQCDPEKVALEAIKAASLDLPIVKSLGYAYVVPYKKVPTFVVGYKGLIQLAQRTGQYKIINADVVYEGELLGFDKLSGIPDIGGERISDKVVGYFAYFRLLNGHEHVFYMSKTDMEAYGKRYSPSYNSNYSPWQTEFDKMALKTVLRQLLSKWGPTSTEMQKAEAYDDKGDTPETEIQKNANKTVIDIDPSTGEVKELPEPQEQPSIPVEETARRGLKMEEAEIHPEPENQLQGPQEAPFLDGLDD